MRLLIIICVLSFLSEAQDSMDTYNINKTYRSYLKKSFLTSSITPFVKRKQKEEPLKSIILGTIHKETGFFKFTKKKSFSVSSFGQSDKQMAAILFGTKYFSIYEFVADDYEITYWFKRYFDERIFKNKNIYNSRHKFHENKK
tara:strand:+ start:63 stop:491 length:429 start_codon:yes stop_codon:yes gene_type:complete